MGNPNKKMQAWIDARKRHRLSHAQVQMARELGMSPQKLGKLDNHGQEPWKMPLPDYLEHLYRKRFGMERRRSCFRSRRRSAATKRRRRGEGKRRLEGDERTRRAGVQTTGKSPAPPDRAHPRSRIVSKASLQAVVDILAEIGARDVFTARRMADVGDLHLRVEGVGEVGFPVSTAQARALRRIARPAHYGKGRRPCSIPTCATPGRSPRAG